MGLGAGDRHDAREVASHLAAVVTNRACGERLPNAAGSNPAAPAFRFTMSPMLRSARASVWMRPGRDTGPFEIPAAAETCSSTDVSVWTCRSCGIVALHPPHAQKPALSECRAPGEGHESVAKPVALYVPHGGKREMVTDDECLLSHR